MIKYHDRKSCPRRQPFFSSAASFAKSVFNLFVARGGRFFFFNMFAVVFIKIELNPANITTIAVFDFFFFF